MKSLLLKLALILVLFTGTLFFQKNIDAARGDYVKDPEYHLRPPSPRMVKALSLGHETLVADIYWMRTVQYYADMTELGRLPEDLYYLAEFITELDPLFEYAYYSTGLILTMENGNRDHIIAILEKGKRNIPQSWRIRFQLGFSYYFLLDEYEKAAQNLDEASEISGFKPYAFLAARIRAEGGNPILSIRFLDQQLEQTTDSYWREKIERHIKELWVSVHINTLNEKLRAFKILENRHAATWEEVFEAGLMKPGEMPREPFGGRYIIDSRTHLADTTTDHKLFVYRPPQKVFKKW